MPASRFWAVVEACGAGTRSRYLQQAVLRLDPRHSLDVAAAVRAALIPSALEELARPDAEAAWDRLGRGPVVCRSSAAMEDGPGAAFPGVFTSVLDLTLPAELARAMARCWRSAFSATAVHYLLRTGTGPVDLSLALLVQRQVEAAWYGVYNTHDPVRGGLEPVADLSDAAPDAVAAAGRAALRARRRAGRWAGLGRATHLAPHLEAVHRGALRLAGRLGAPVDVEFALPRSGGEPVLLQFRPLTAGLAAPGAGGLPAAAQPPFQGRPCAPGVVMGTARDPHRRPHPGPPPGPGSEPDPAVAVVDELTAADYQVVFAHAAVVCEADLSPLGHAAILCRELGVPLVAGAAGARARFAGRRVAVDGGRGLVAEVTGPPVASVAPRPGPPAAPVPGALSSIELVVRLLAEGRPGQPAAAEAHRLVSGYAAALGLAEVTIVPGPLPPGDRAELERLGAGLFGPGSSAAAALEGAEPPGAGPPHPG